MAATIVTIVAADNGGTAAVVPVTITLVSVYAGIFNGVGASVQRVRTTATASDGTLSLPVDPNSDLSDTASTYTIQVGSEVYANLVVPASGPVTLDSLVATAVSHTVVVTEYVIDPSEGPVSGLVATTTLSIDSVNLSGKKVLAQRSIQATSDITGLLAWHLDRTDQLTPVGGGPEPYYTSIVGSSTYYYYVRGAGSISSMTPAIPTSSSGGYGATASNITAVENTPTSLHGSPASVQDVLDDAIYKANHAAVGDASTSAIGGVEIDRAVSGHPVVPALISGTVAPGVLPVATTSAFGAVKPDGTTVTIAGGVISSTGGSPITTQGDLIAGASGGTPARLALGSPGQVPAPVGSDVGWVTPTGLRTWPFPYLAPNTLLAGKTAASVSTIGVVFCGDSLTYGSTLTTPATQAMPVLVGTLLSAYGITATISNQGVPSTTTYDWQPGGANLTAAFTAAASIGARIIYFTLGTNDAGIHYPSTPVSAAQHGTNVLATSAACIAAGYLPVWGYPPYNYDVNLGSDGFYDSGTNPLLAAYQGVTDILTAGGAIHRGDTSLYVRSKSGQATLYSTDGVHLNAAGHTAWAALVARALHPLVRSLTGQQAVAAVSLDASLQIVSGALGVVGGATHYEPVVLSNAGGSVPIFIINSNGQVVMTRIAN